MSPITDFSLFSCSVLFKQQLAIRLRPLKWGWPQVPWVNLTPLAQCYSVKTLALFPLWASGSPPVQWAEQCLPDGIVGIGWRGMCESTLSRV